MQDPAGRYARYVDRDNGGSPALHNLVPRQRQKDVIIEPYIYPYNGVDVMLTSIAAPVMRDGKFQGSATADFSLETLQKMIGAIKPWEGAGYALLLSAENKVISSPDKTTTGKVWSGTVAGDAVIRIDDPCFTRTCIRDLASHYGGQQPDTMEARHSDPGKRGNGADMAQPA